MFCGGLEPGGHYAAVAEVQRCHADTCGTLAGDCVQYAVWGGALVDKLVIRRDVERIFDYRKQTLTAMFANGEVR